MTPTSLSLLERLREAPSPSDWQRLYDIYQHYIRGWLTRVPGLGDEADDLTQEVMIVVVREIPKFERQREGSFRAWLRNVTVNRIRDYWRSKAKRPIAGLDNSSTDDFLGQLADPASALSAQWDREHDKRVFERLLLAVRKDFSPENWEAFRCFALEGKPAAQVAEELGLTQNAVILSKSRILKRLRDEAGILLD